MATATAPKKVSASRPVEASGEAEEILAARNIEWEHRNIMLSEIDLARSLMFNAREEHLNQHWVDTYRLSYEKGEALPPIIVMRASARSKRLLVLSGHHRVAGAKAADRKSLPGYVTDPLPDTLRLDVITAANRTVGFGLTELQRVENALRHVRTGDSAAAAAAKVGIHVDKVRRRLAEERATERLQKATATWSRWQPSVRVRLDAIQSDEILKKAVTLADSANMNAAEISNLVRDINKARTDVAREEVVDTMWQVYANRVKTKGRYAPKTAAQGGYLGLMRASIYRLGNPEIVEHLDEILLAKKPGMREALMNAKAFVDLALERWDETHGEA